MLCNCKKMLALLVTARDFPYKDGSFLSGSNGDDYAKWYLAAFHSSEISGVYWADNACTTMTSNTSTSIDRQEQKDPVSTDDAGQHDVLALSVGENEY